MAIGEWMTEIAGNIPEIQRLDQKPLLVMKFGGTSVGDAKPIERTTGIVRQYIDQGNSLVLVISAARARRGKRSIEVTNQLVEICDLISRGHIEELQDWADDILSTHEDIASLLDLDRPLASSLRAKFYSLHISLSRDLAKVSVMTPKLRDKIISYGERFNVYMVAANLNAQGIKAEPIEATDIIETDNSWGQAVPNFPKTKYYAERILQPLIEVGITPVVTGFIGATSENDVTTLGRGGSDYTASILGKVLGADEVWIWTDVDGVYSEDPRVNPNARLLPRISYDLADEMAKAGNRVLYPKTVEPLVDSEIILRVKNTFKPSAPGTEISRG
ncbi:aspartate kinase [Candidatus Daviesbacteria bacterium]|nr:aspartate kinase [Candidatus Daviesbacteria bacterium]